MSGAIWGVYKRQGTIQEEELYSVETYQKIYQADMFQELKLSKLWMRSALLDIRSYSCQEKLPFYLEQADLAVVADVILDNRQDLYDALNIEKSIQDTTDGELILQSYLKWGDACVKHLIGDFAFVVIHLKEDKIYCARDHMGLRTLYYSSERESFRFGTLMEMTRAPKAEFKLNEGWLADFLAIPGILHEIRDNETLHEGLYLLEPAHYMVIAQGQLTKTCYWTPYDVEKLYNKLTDDQCYQKVHDVFVEAVKTRIECNTDVGVLLSSGLDSSTIAGVAATLCVGTEKQICGFTWVPAFEVDEPEEGCLYDEGQWVDELVDMHPKLTGEKHSFPENTAVSVAEVSCQINEGPYKFVVNSVWYYSMIKWAATKGCKVVLTGAYGNLAYSSGERMDTMAKAVCHFRFKEVDEILKYMHEVLGYRRKSLIRQLIRDVLPRFIRKGIRLVKHGPLEDTKDSFLKQDIVNQYAIEDRLYRSRYSTIHESSVTKTEFALVQSPFVLNQIAVSDVKEGLAQKVIVRDPSRDIRLVRLCLNVPYTAKCSYDQDRKLVRVGLGNYVTERIRSNESVKGLQGHDFQKRLEADWPVMIKALKSLLETSEIRYLLDEKLVAKGLAIDNPVDPEHYLEVEKIVQLFVALQFFKNKEK